MPPSAGQVLVLKLAENILMARNSQQVKVSRVEYVHWRYQDGLYKRKYVDETGDNSYTKEIVL